MGSNVSATFRNIRSFRANIWWALGFRGLSDWNWGSFRYCWTWMWNLKTCTLASACGNVVRWAGSGRFMKSFPVLRKNAREIGQVRCFSGYNHKWHVRVSNFDCCWSMRFACGVRQVKAAGRKLEDLTRVSHEPSTHSTVDGCRSWDLRLHRNLQGSLLHVT